MTRIFRRNHSKFCAKVTGIIWRQQQQRAYILRYICNYEAAEWFQQRFPLKFTLHSLTCVEECCKLCKLRIGKYTHTHTYLNTQIGYNTSFIQQAYSALVCGNAEHFRFGVVFCCWLTLIKNVRMRQEVVNCIKPNELFNFEIMSANVVICEKCSCGKI